MATTVTETATDRRKREEQEKRRKALFLLFLLLIGDTYEHLSQAVTAYLSGTLNIHVFAGRFVALMVGAHTAATYYGRQAAGTTSPLSATDHQFAQSVMAGQAQYVTGLTTALSDRDYTLDDDGALPGSLANRLLLWARSIRATAEEAWCLSLPKGTRIYWRLGTEPEHHCAVCPEIAAAGPYDAHDMPTFPGRGDTPCLANCYCFLETEDGLRCFVLE